MEQEIKQNREEIKLSFFKSLSGQLIIRFSLLLIIPIVLIGIINYIMANIFTRTNVFRQLDALVENKKLLLEHQVEYWKKAVQIISDDTMFRTNLPIIAQYQTDRTNTASTYQNSKDALRQKASVIGDYADIIIADTSGRIILTTSKEEEDQEGTDISSYSYFREGGKGLYVSDIFHERGHESKMIIANPVKGEDGRLLSVLLLEINAEGVNEVMKKRTGLGETGETYIVGKDKLMRTDSQFIPNAALKQLVDTEGVRAALEGKEGHGEYKDYRGKKVVGSYRWMPEREWALIAEIDASEAFASLNRMLFAFIIILVLVAIVVIIITAYFVAHPIVTPVLELSNMATVITEGDLAQDVEISGKYELGILARAFAQMIYGMRSIVASVRDAAARVSASAEQISAVSKQISDGTQTQASATAEVSAAAEEISKSIDAVAKSADSLASSVSETSASIRQMAGNIQAIFSSSSSISLTIEETAASINEMAASIKDVSENAQNTAKFTDTVNESAVWGNDAVKQTEKGLKQISDIFSEVTKSIESLSEKSLEIDAIIKTVDDMADRTNLLALNSAVEAARAGEHGEGFRVLAEEIRDLAVEERENTRQITQIIKDIQKSMRLAVESVESGKSSVDDGIRQAQSSREALDIIVKQVQQANQMAKQISTATEEQLSVSNAIVKAMEEAKKQILELDSALEEQSISGQQIEKAAEDMRKLTEGVRTAMQQQVISARETAKAIQEIDRIAQNALATATEASKAADSLKASAENLLSSISQFKISPDSTTLVPALLPEDKLNY
jgi:methyl-accepting chemotaxis protein